MSDFCCFLIEAYSDIAASKKSATAPRNRSNWSFDIRKFDIA